MLGSVLTQEIWAIGQDKPYGRESFIKAVRGLPESWERLRQDPQD